MGQETLVINIKLLLPFNGHSFIGVHTLLLSYLLQLMTFMGSSIYLMTNRYDLHLIAFMSLSICLMDDLDKFTVITNYVVISFW